MQSSFKTNMTFLFLLLVRHAIFLNALTNYNLYLLGTIETLNYLMHLSPNIALSCLERLQTFFVGFFAVYHSVLKENYFLSGLVSIFDITYGMNMLV